MHSQIRNDYSTQGVLTERLGNGLQNRVERFDSARHLESFIKHLLGVCKQKTLQGVLTERLGHGLQNRVERFDSARHLIKRKFFNKDFLFTYHPLPHFHSSFLGIHQNPHF